MAEISGVDVIAAPERVAAVLPPIRRRLLENLHQPDSASGLARRLGIPRQKVNYHLRELERTGFVELAEERQRRGCVERLVKVTARAFVVSHDFLEGLAADPAHINDQFSSAYLVANSARTIRDVGLLRDRAARAGQQLATLSIETEAAFASPADFRAFSQELAGQIARLTTKYSKPGGTARRFRVFAGIHPVVTKSETQARNEEAAKKQHRRKGSEER